MFNDHTILLGIETSCDETAASVCIDGKIVLSNVISSQIATHRTYGGVVPEIASRLHIDCIDYVTRCALDEAGISLNDIDAICATKGPGLSGALLVGYSFAKSLSYANGIRLIPVNHLLAHISANYLLCKIETLDDLNTLTMDNFPSSALNAPFICLLVSGGHTSLCLVKSKTDIEILGQTIDDAAGEAFDKVARALNLPYPGGPQIEKNALDFNNKEDVSIINLFPRGSVKDKPYDFTFSGLKSAVLNYINKYKVNSKDIKEVQKISYAFQESVFDALLSRTILLAKEKNITKVALAGGVAANKTLRMRLDTACKANNLQFFVPDIRWTTDNAAMVCAEGYLHLNDKNKSYIDSDIFLD